MKRQLSFIQGWCLSLLASFICGQKSDALEMPTIGQRLPVAGFELINQIPASHIRQLPSALPTYRYSAKPSDIPVETLQTLIDKSVFVGTNALDLLNRSTNSGTSGDSIRLTTARGLDFLVITPSKGAVLLQNQNRDFNPSPDAVPSFEVVRQELLRYAQAFGISTNDMEKREGDIHPIRTEDKISRRGGAVKFIARRSVAFSRSISGHTLLANGDKIELALGLNGSLLKFDLNWPTMEAVSTNQLYTIDQILAEIKKGNFLGDLSNEYPTDGVAEIVLKAIRIDYYSYSHRGFGPASTNTDIFPVASLYAVFKSKLGKTTEGGLYAPAVMVR